jgi:formylglycine-generating enzyme
MDMKKYLLIMSLLVIMMITSCTPQGQSGELMQGQKGGWIEPVPYGMSFIPRGSIRVGPSDEDPTRAINPTLTMSVDAFWMDDTEITNGEYRQFVNWVRDSLALGILFRYNRDNVNQSQDSLNYAIFKDNDPLLGRMSYNYKYAINWNSNSKDSINIVRDSLFLQGKERFMGEVKLDTRKLSFTYYWINFQKAAKRAYSFNYKTGTYDPSSPDSTRDIFFEKETVHIYPDTLCWIRDFTYSYNDPWTSKYFWHPGFFDYPVVGVTWKQANAFCQWRTKMQNNFFAENKQATVQDYRLPTEWEWEFAARGGLQNSMFPWGGYYSRNQEGTFMANYKPMRGNYIVDGGLATMKVGSYAANDFGLYDMSGNVAEWTITAWDPLSTAMVSDLNPNYQYNAKDTDPPAMHRKVIRGGSWKDIGYYIQTSTRTYEYQDSAKSFIGFRCVRPSFGNNL